MCADCTEMLCRSYDDTVAPQNQRPDDDKENDKENDQRENVDQETYLLSFWETSLHMHDIMAILDAAELNPSDGDNINLTCSITTSLCPRVIGERCSEVFKGIPIRIYLDTVELFRHFVCNECGETHCDCGTEELRQDRYGVYHSTDEV